MTKIAGMVVVVSGLILSEYNNYSNTFKKGKI